MGGKLTFPGGGIYHATKYAVEAISDAMRFEVRGFGVNVVCIEPGLIKTEFGNAAVARSPRAPARAAPTREFNPHVAEATAGAYDEGPLAKLGGGPDAVAQGIEKALTVAQARGRATGNPLGPPGDRPAADRFRPGMGRDDAFPVPDTRVPREAEGSS